MTRMHYLIKAYIRFIDEDPKVTSNLNATPVSATKDQEIDSTDVNEPSDSYNATSANSWGTCAFNWLEGLVGQAHAAKWLWNARNQYLFDMEFLVSNTPVAEPLLWEQQTQLKAQLEISETPQTFDEISTILTHSHVKHEFDGAVHAEVIVAAILHKRNGGKLLIGISRPPCYVCYQVLRLIGEERESGLGCRPRESSACIWPVDLPTQLSENVLSETLKVLSHDAAQTFFEHRDIIKSLADEARNHTSHIRSASVSSSRSNEMGNAGERGINFGESEELHPDLKREEFVGTLEEDEGKETGNL